MRKKETEFNNQVKIRLDNSEDSKYKNEISGLAAIDLNCSKIVERLLPFLTIKSDFCEIELGKGLGIFFNKEEIKKSFLHKDRKHLSKSVLIGAGYNEKKIHSIINESTFKEKEIKA